MKMTYTGLSDPKSDFAELAPAVDKLTAMMMKVSPASEEYRLLQEARSAIQKAGQFITGDERLYSSRSPSV